MIDIKSYDLSELKALIAQIHQPEYKALQIFKWLQKGVSSFDEMTDISKDLREELKKIAEIRTAKIKQKFTSALDDTAKYLFEMFDGECVESVLMKYEHGYSICISTQVGCNMGCKFCASGLFGKTRDLTASEMLSQITSAQNDRGVRISNVVMMGMGEPLDNFQNSARFLKLVSDENGLNIGLRHISLSTCGIVPGIRDLAGLDMPITLSISLHAPYDDIRSSLMPVNKKWNIEKLLAACREYQAVTTRRISFEYALISGVNDTLDCARRLSEITKGIMCHINLIPANPVAENSFSKPDSVTINKFKDILVSLGMTVTVRRTLGADIDASCGQLRKRYREVSSSEAIHKG